MKISSSELPGDKGDGFNKVGFERKKKPSISSHNLVPNNREMTKNDIMEFEKIINFKLSARHKRQLIKKLKKLNLPEQIHYEKIDYINKIADKQ